MDDLSNRIEGTATDLGGRAQSAFGDLTGDTKTQAQGSVDQLKGKAQDVLGQAQGALGKVGDQIGQAWDGAPAGVKDRINQAGATAKRNPVLTLLAIGAASAALTHLLGKGRGQA